MSWNATARATATNAETRTDAPFDLLRRCRRRLTAVAAVRYAGITVPIAIVSSEAMAFAARPGPAVLTVLITATIGLALAAALIAAMVGAPSLRGAAAAVDGRLRLQDRMVTALHVSNDHDPMARLVVRDAAARVAGLSPSQMFALEQPAHFRAIVAGAVSLSVAFAMAAAATSPAWRIERPRGVGSAVTGGAQQGRVSPRGPQQPGASAVPSPSAPRLNKAPQVAASQEVARGTEPAVGCDLGRTPAGLKTGGSRGGSPSASASADRDLPGSTVPVGAAAAGRGAVGETQDAIRAAGGVKGESLRPPVSAADATSPDSTLSSTYAARYRTASSRAQAAIAQERVPAGFGTYVRNYFIAIRP
jgi:hypothetical protein